MIGQVYHKALRPAHTSLKTSAEKTAVVGIGRHFTALMLIRGKCYVEGLAKQHPNISHANQLQQSPVS